MKPSWRTVLVVAGVGLGAGITLPPTWSFGAGDPIGDQRQKVISLIPPIVRTTSTVPVDFIVEGHHFRIPRAYFSTESYWGGGTVTSIVMKGTLPGLKPYSEETRHHYDTGIPGLRKQVPFWIEGYSGEGTGPHLKYFVSEFLEKCTDGPFGFRRCQDFVSKNNYVFVKQDRRRQIALRCEKEDVASTLICGINLPLMDGIYLHLNFDRSKLAQAEAIITTAYKVVCSFYVDSPGRSITYNYCSNGVFHKQ